MAASQVSDYSGGTTTDARGRFYWQPLKVASFNRVHLLIEASEPLANATAVCYMGKFRFGPSSQTIDQFIAESTAQTVAQFPLSPPFRIRTFDVIGPEFSIVFTDCPPNTDVSVKAWVLLQESPTSSG